MPYTEPATIHDAIKNCHFSAILDFIDQGHINQIDNNGDSPLHVVFQQNFPPSQVYLYVKFFVDQGANVNLQDKMGFTVLKLAACNKDQLATVKYLLKKGADVNLKDEYGNTALHNAVFYSGNIDTVKALVRAGADTNLSNENGETPFQQVFRFTTIVPDLERKQEYLNIAKYLKLQELENHRYEVVQEDVSNVSIWKHNFFAAKNNAENANIQNVKKSKYLKPILPFWKKSKQEPSEHNQPQDTMDFVVV